MGCECSTQPNLVEQVLNEAEKDSGIKRLKSSEVDYAVRKHSVGRTLSTEHVTQIANELNIPMRNDDHARFGDFFQSFQRREVSNRDSLLVTLLMLSSSRTPRDKMELLFEVLDRNATNHLKHYQLSQLIQYMLEAAILHVPKLLSRRENINKVELASYLTRLEARMKLGTKVLSDRILCGRDQVTLIQFLGAILDKSFDDVSRCGGLREFVLTVETVKLVRVTPGSEKQT